MPAYDNSAIAAKLDLYADLLEISGADKYRFLSYKKAANSIRAWPEQLVSLSEQGRLTEVPGVGARMAGIVESIISSGSFADLDALRESVPASLASVMEVPGVGPKRAWLLYEKLGISDVDDLEAALADGRVARLGGFGPKTAEKIGTSLASHRKHRERIPIGEALPVAEQLVADIAALPEVLDARIVGSVRRRAETVGNIDLLVTTEDPLAARAALAGLPAVENVLRDEPEGALELELHDGAPVRVHTVRAREAARALVYYTGSVAFGEALAQRASASGVPVAPLPNGGWDSPAGQMLCTEEEVFSALGMQHVAPEAREDAAMLVVAERGELPELVTLSAVRGDLQTHSTFTDGKNTIEENRALATELGYEYLAATDHAYALRMVGGLDLDGLERQWSEIDELNARDEAGTRILKGIELNIGEGGVLDYDDEVLARFDIVLASLHSGWDQDEATITQRALAAIEHPLVDVIAHPTGRILGRRDPLKLDMDAVLAAAGETGTIMEINSYPDRLDLSDAHIKLARRYGVRFSLGTDAHAAPQLRYMRYGVSQARRGLVTESELLNAQPWETARTWLKRYRLLG